MNRKAAGMTEKQRQYVYQVEKEIRGTKEGKRFKVFASVTIVRLQDTEDNRNYRMMVVCSEDTKEKIRTKMLELYQEMRMENERTI